jgi:hypothetical protein
MTTTAPPRRVPALHEDLSRKRRKENPFRNAAALCAFAREMIILLMHFRPSPALEKASPKICKKV